MQVFIPLQRAIKELFIYSAFLATYKEVLSKELKLTAVSEIISAFPELINHHSGDTNQLVSNPSDPDLASENSIIFVQNLKYLESALKSEALTLVIPEKTNFADFNTNKKVILTSKNPALAQSKICQKFFAISKNKVSYSEQNIHSTAIVHPTASLGENVIIQPNVVIGPGVKIGNNVVIGANTCIEADTQIGSGSHIHPQVFIGHSTEIGNNCEIHPQSSIGTEGYGYSHDEKGNHYRIPHYGKVILEDDVHIGANYSIDRGTFKDTIIHRGAKLDNHGHIAHNCEIGENSLVTAGFLMAGSAKVGKNFVCGGRTAVAGHLSVCDNVMISGVSNITKPINKPGKYGGFPVQSYSDNTKTLASLPSLPKLRKEIAKIKKKLGIADD